jgi:hypothetical protein
MVNGDSQIPHTVQRKLQNNGNTKQSSDRSVVTAAPPQTEIDMGNSRWSSIQ